VKPYYQDSAVTIYHGDCREILPELLKVDLILTDPPYGIGAYSAGSMGGGVLAKQSCFEATTWDSTPAAVEHIIPRGRAVIIWGGNYFGLPPSPGWLVWDKRNGANFFADCELAWTNLQIAVRLISYRWQGMLQENMAEKDVRLHPTQKPIAVMAWCIRLAGDIRTILDPFMGSGTTLRAAKDLGRKAIGIEIEERYCEIAARRMAQEVLNFAA
jgi:DNA modification methylase